MSQKTPQTIMAIGQQGKTQFEALFLAASLRRTNPNFTGELLICEPQPGPLWQSDPRMDDDIREKLCTLGAKIIPFENKVFGESYPIGNKIEALNTLPDRPFLFLDSDTLIIGDLRSVIFPFKYPSASMQREATWPKPILGEYDRDCIWRALYTHFQLDFESSLDLTYPHNDWRRYLYFNAGWFFYESPRVFGALFLYYAKTIRDHSLNELSGQNLYPWLDQIALPLTIHTLKGGRPNKGLSGLDETVTRHWRRFPLLYARETDDVVQQLEGIASDPQLKPLFLRHIPAHDMVYNGKGMQARALFNRTNLPETEQKIRNLLRVNGLWP